MPILVDLAFTLVEAALAVALMAFAYRCASLAILARMAMVTAKMFILAEVFGF